LHCINYLRQVREFSLPTLIALSGSRP
jgi:hypothetical protein